MRLELRLSESSGRSALNPNKIFLDKA